MNKWLFIIPFFFISNVGFSQFVDDFSDGNFSKNPNWVGDTGKFVVDNSLRLQLLAPAEANEAQLLTRSKAVINGNWEAFIQMDFNPSSANKSRFIITSNSSNINQPYTGYYIEIGGTNDEVSLYKSVNNNTTKLIDGRNGMLNTNAVNVRIKVSNDSLGNWQLFADSTGNFNYELIGTAFDNEITTSAYAGIWCDYTSTRSTKFWFDDIIVSGDTLPDVKAPKLLSTTLSADSLLRLTFNEKIDSNLTITSQPHIAFTTSYNNTEVVLQFNPVLTNGVSYELSLSNVMDISGNKMPDTTLVITYLKPMVATFRDVVFNEILSDPTPVFDLPEQEFIELYNTSDKVISLKDWSLINSGNVKTLPEYILLPKHYVLLASSTAVNELSAFGDVIGISGWTALNNGGDDLQLLNNELQIIDELNYSINWHTNDTASNGGWTLEQINPDVICTDASNWKSSKGSPNQLNIHHNPTHDLTPPTINKVIKLTKTQLVLELSEAINNNTFSTQSITFSPQVNLLSASFNANSKYIVIRTDSLFPKTPYSVTINIADCSGNNNTVSVSELYVPEEIKPQDLVVNEILFNPYPTGTDFVEIINLSDKFIDLSSLTLGVIKAADTSWSSYLAEDYALMAPNEYRYFTEDILAISPFYSQKNGVNVSILPAMNDDEGHLILVNNKTEVIDEVIYYEEDHLDAINDLEGISLEKINPNILSKTTNNNWHSAASSVGYATPGYINSQFHGKESTSLSFSLNPTRISPNNDGIDDVLAIQINTTPGLGTITIFNLSGQVIKTIHHQIILGQANTIYWDGLDDNGQLTPVGNYIIVAELVLENGKVEVMKEAFAVVTNK